MVTATSTTFNKKANKLCNRIGEHYYPTVAVFPNFFSIFRQGKGYGISFYTNETLDTSLTKGENEEEKITYVRVRNGEGEVIGIDLVNALNDAPIADKRNRVIYKLSQFRGMVVLSDNPSSQITQEQVETIRKLVLAEIEQKDENVNTSLKIEGRKLPEEMVISAEPPELSSYVIYRVFFEKPLELVERLAQMRTFFNYEVEHVDYFSSPEKIKTATEQVKDECKELHLDHFLDCDLFSYDLVAHGDTTPIDYLEFYAVYGWSHVVILSTEKSNIKTWVLSSLVTLKPSTSF